jgi:hypothetical protein
MCVLMKRAVAIGSLNNTNWQAFGIHSNPPGMGIKNARITTRKKNILKATSWSRCFCIVFYVMKRVNLSEAPAIYAKPERAQFKHKWSV